jgi:hypothetical protein
MRIGTVVGMARSVVPPDATSFPVFPVPTGNFSIFSLQARFCHKIAEADQVLAGEFP